MLLAMLVLSNADANDSEPKPNANIVSIAERVMSPAVP